MTSSTAELRRALHRAADAAIVADDALRDRDPAALRRAMDMLAANTEAAPALATVIIADPTG